MSEILQGPFVLVIHTLVVLLVAWIGMRLEARDRAAAALASAQAPVAEPVPQVEQRQEQGVVAPEPAAAPPTFPVTTTYDVAADTDQPAPLPAVRPRVILDYGTGAHAGYVVGQGTATTFTLTGDAWFGGTGTANVTVNTHTNTGGWVEQVRVRPRRPAPRPVQQPPVRADHVHLATQKMPMDNLRELLLAHVANRPEYRGIDHVDVMLWADPRGYALSFGLGPQRVTVNLTHQEIENIMTRAGIPYPINLDPAVLLTEDRLDMARDDILQGIARRTTKRYFVPPRSALIPCMCRKVMGVMPGFTCVICGGSQIMLNPYCWLTHPAIPALASVDPAASFQFVDGEPYTVKLVEPHYLRCPWCFGYAYWEGSQIVGDCSFRMQVQPTTHVKHTAACRTVPQEVVDDVWAVMEEHGHNPSTSLMTDWRAEILLEPFRRSVDIAGRTEEPQMTLRMY